MLTALVLLLYAAAIALAGDRRRQTLRAVGFSFIFVGVVVLFARGAAGNLVVGSLSEVGVVRCGGQPPSSTSAAR